MGHILPQILLPKTSSLAQTVGPLDSGNQEGDNGWVDEAIPLQESVQTTAAAHPQHVSPVKISAISTQYLKYLFNIYHILYCVSTISTQYPLTYVRGSTWLPRTRRWLRSRRRRPAPGGRRGPPRGSRCGTRQLSSPPCLQGRFQDIWKKENLPTRPHTEQPEHYCRHHS